MRPPMDALVVEAICVSVNIFAPARRRRTGAGRLSSCGYYVWETVQEERNSWDSQLEGPSWNGMKRG